MQEMVADAIIERHRDEIPENPKSADIAPFAAEIEACLFDVEKSRELFATVRTCPTRS